MNLTDIKILEIIDACKGHVKSIKISNDSVEINFIEPHQPVEKSPLTHNQGINPAAEIDSDKNLAVGLSPAIPQERVDEDALLENLHITNPLALEEMIAMKEVVNEETHD